MKPCLLILSIVVELVAAVFLIKNIFEKQRLTSFVHLIKKNDVVFRNISKLKYYYEPISNHTQKEWNLSWLKDQITYTINNDSLNERCDYSQIKPNNVFRIITMGDSFTFGLFVNTEENFSEKLEDELNHNYQCRKYSKFEVINLGVPGYDIQYSIERLRLRGLKYKPDLAIWFIQNNDFEEINDMIQEKIQHDLLNLKQSGNYEKLLKQGIPYPETLKLGEYTKELTNKLGKDKIYQIQSDSLNELNSIYSHPLLIITFPSLKDSYKTLVLDFIKKRKNGYFYDQVPDIFMRKELTFYPNDYHPTQKGHQIIAEDLLNYLTNNKIIPCN